MAQPGPSTASTSIASPLSTPFSVPKNWTPLQNAIASVETVSATVYDVVTCDALLDQLIVKRKELSAAHSSGPGSELAKCQADLKTKNEKLARQEGEISSLKDNLTSLTNDLAARDNRILELQSTITTLTMNLGIAQKEILNANDRRRRIGQDFRQQTQILEKDILRLKAAAAHFGDMGEGDAEETNGAGSAGSHQS